MSFVDDIKMWGIAARPKSWCGAVLPVLVGVAMAYSKGVVNVPVSLLCLLMALFAQVTFNFANDYIEDMKSVALTGRRERERAIDKGWISSSSVMVATIITLILTLVAGVILLSFTSWRVFVWELAVIIGIFAYSAGPYPLSAKGWGDVAVLVFYGIVPMCGTVYALTGEITMRSFLLSLSMGLVAMNVMVVDNYSNFESDKLVGKRTTIIRYGHGFGEMLYILCAALSLVTAVLGVCITDSLGESIVANTDDYLSMIGSDGGSFTDIYTSNKFWLAIFTIESAVLQFIAWQKLKKSNQENIKDVQRITSLNVLLWALFLSIILVM